MANDESQDTSGPSLEPPKLFGRRRTDAPETPEATEGDTRVFQDAEMAEFADAGVDAPVRDESDEADDVAAATHAPQSWKPRRTRTARGPLVIPGHVGAPVAGLLTGVALLGFMWLGFRGCEAITGTESCGKGPGLIALIVVFAAAVLLGKLLLSLMKLPEPGMTSFLAVGVTSLIAVLILGGILDSTAILFVLPLLTAAAYGGAWWLTTVQLGEE